MASYSDLRQFQYTCKRIFDTLISTVSLLVLLLPCMLLALAIRIDSKGNVIFRHRRIGKDGRTFYMFKFRSMVDSNNDVGYMQYLQQLIQSEKDGKNAGMPYRKMEGDPRITRVGKFIRRYYLDELPQLINVVIGDMSLVGPRPHVQLEVDHYTPEQRRRLSVRPGLTGLWQVDGKADCTFSQLIDLDLNYIDHWSLFLDLKIIIKTLISMFHGGEQFTLRKQKLLTRRKPAVSSEKEITIQDNPGFN